MVMSMCQCVSKHCSPLAALRQYLGRPLGLGAGLQGRGLSQAMATYAGCVLVWLGIYMQELPPTAKSQCMMRLAHFVC